MSQFRIVSTSRSAAPALASSPLAFLALGALVLASTACSAMRRPRQSGSPELRGDEVATTMITATDMLPPPAPREPAAPVAAPVETADASPVIELDDESPIIELDDESPIIELDDEPVTPPAKSPATNRRASQAPKTDAEAIADVKIHR